MARAGTQAEQDRVAQGRSAGPGRADPRPLFQTRLYLLHPWSRRRVGGLTESQENPPYGGGLCDEGADARVGAAAGADERQGEEQAGDEQGPRVVR
jgi:hypothetical protein